jgi:hypothetical protein
MPERNKGQAPHFDACPLLVHLITVTRLMSQ